MSNLHKHLLAGAATVALAVGGTSSAKADLLPFTVNPADLGYTGGSGPKQADEITLNSSALVTQNVGGQSEEGWAQITDLKHNGVTVGFTNDGVGIYSTPISPNPTGFYGLYITFNATTPLTNFTSQGPITTFTFSLFGDVGANDTFTAANSATATSATVSSPDSDILLATGSLAPSFPSFAGFNVNGGPVIGLTTTFSLTAAGSAYFIAPVPFYQFEFTTSTGSQAGNASIHGNLAALTTTLDASFAVPEPASLALLGGALVSLGGLARRKRRRQNRPTSAA